MADAYPQLVRCAQHQLPEDKFLWAHLLDRHRMHKLLRPNLMVRTGPPARPQDTDEHGALVAMLVLKAG